MDNNQTPAINNPQAIQLVVFNLDNEEYALPISDVKEVINYLGVTPIPTAPEFVSGVINLRGKIIPVWDLQKKFGLIDDKNLPPEHILIVEESQTKTPYGVLVNKVTEVLRINPDKLKPAPMVESSKINSAFIKGVVVITEESKGKPDLAEISVVKTGRLILLLDMQKIITDSDLEKTKQPVEAAVREVQISSVQPTVNA